MQPTVPLSGGDTADTDSSNGHHRPEVYGPSGRSEWLNTDWSKHQRWVSVDGQPVNTIDLGDGPPIVFVHGLTGSWPNWLEQLPVFAGRPQSDGSPLARNRVVAMDLPGFGHSPMPREQITISFYARLLDGLLDQLGIDAAAIVGNSMGGFIAAELAIAFPQRVERLVLVSPAGISTYRDRRETLVPMLRRFEPALTALTAWGASRADVIMSRPALRQAVLRDLVRYPGRLPATIAAELVRGAGKPGFMQALAANFDYDFRDRLHEIVCPTLIVWGDHDRIVTVRDAAVYAELIPGSRKVIFNDTGHMAMVERPDAFNSLLGEFLSE